MTKRDEIRMIVNDINLNKQMRGVYLKAEYENNLWFIRVYKGDSCEKSMFGGLKPSDAIQFLYAFKAGLEFIKRYADE